MVRLPHIRAAALLPVLALGLATLLGGCVVYPDEGYGYRSGPYYRAPVVGYGGWGWGHHRRHDDD